MRIRDLEGRAPDAGHGEGSTSIGSASRLARMTGQSSLSIRPRRVATRSTLLTSIGHRAGTKACSSSSDSRSRSVEFVASSGKIHAMVSEQSRTNAIRTCVLPRSSRVPIPHPGRAPSETPSGSRSPPGSVGIAHTERDQLRDGTVMPSDDEPLPFLHSLEQSRKVCLGLEGSDFGHAGSPIDYGTIFDWTETSLYFFTDQSGRLSGRQPDPLGPSLVARILPESGHPQAPGTTTR